MNTAIIIVAILLTPSIAFMSIRVCGWVSWRLGCERRDLIQRNRDLVRQINAVGRHEWARRIGMAAVAGNN